MATLTNAQQQAWRKIDALDLTSIVQGTRKGQGWNAQEAKDADLWYRRFLKMCIVNGKKPVAALSSDADKVWHYHILDTPRYQADCKSLFGRYLNHQPITGRRTAAQTKAIKDTNAMSIRLFGTPPPNSKPACWQLVGGSGS
jgi:hypothetical protein